MQLSGFRKLLVCTLLLSSVLFASAAQHAASEAGQSRKSAAGIGAPASVALPFTITELSGAADAAKIVGRKSSSSSSSGVTSDTIDSSHSSKGGSSSISSAASAAIDAVTRAATLAAVAAKIRAAHMVPSSGSSGSNALPDDAKAKLQQLVLGATFSDAAPSAAAAADKAAVQATSSAPNSKPGPTTASATSETVLGDAGLEDAVTESESDAESAAADDSDGDDDVTSDINPAAADGDAAAAAAAAETVAALDLSMDAESGADAAQAGESAAAAAADTDSAESADEMDLGLLLAGDTADAAAADADGAASVDTAEAANDSAAGDKGAEEAEDSGELDRSDEGDEEVVIIEEEEFIDADAEFADPEGADATETEAAAAAAAPPPPPAAAGGKAAGNAHARIAAAAAADAVSAATGHRKTASSAGVQGTSKSSAAAAAAADGSESSDSTVYKKPSAVADATPSTPQPAPAPAPAPSGSEKKTNPKSDTKSDAHHKGKGSSMSIAQVQKTLQHELKHAAKHPGHGTEVTTSTIKAKLSKGAKQRHHHHKHTNHSSHAKAGKTSKASKVALSPAALKRVAHALGVSPKVVKTQAQTAIQKHKQLVKLAEQQREKQAALKRQVQQVVEQQLQLQSKVKSDLQTKAKAELKQAGAPAPSAVQQQQAAAAASESKGQQQDYSNKQQQQQQQEDPQETEQDQVVEDEQQDEQQDQEAQEPQQDQQQDQEGDSLTSEALVKLINAADDKSPCFRPLLQPPFFDREKSASLNNAYVAMLLSRYTYPTAFGINVNTNSSRLTYQELFRRKWIALGAKPNTIKFQDIGGGPGARWRKIINAAKPEAHAVVLGTDTDVWIAYRGLTSVDAALTSDLKHSPVDAVFGSRKVAVHSGFYNGFRALWPQVVMAVKAATMQTNEPTEAKIYITGHSLGGAHALFTGLKLAEMKLKNLGGVYIFGTPRIGGPEFLALFKESGLERITNHWWNELDMVPNLGTAGPWKRSHYQSLPISTLYRIWGGHCKRANQATAQACPLGPHRCKKSINDHRAFSYVAKLQACVLQQPGIESSSCMSSKVMSSM